VATLDGLVEHLFRRESGRMIAALARVFGTHQLSLAEDVVQDVLCRALEIWKFRGIPENPSAWLMVAAKNRAIDVLRHERTAKMFSVMFSEGNASSAGDDTDLVNRYFGASEIKDSQLQMMFSCCNPALSEDAQIALTLHVLCGFSTREIAAAFLATVSAIEKRLSRAKSILAGTRHLFELDEASVRGRLPAVHRTLYLLFNEGFHGSNPQFTTRKELCEEAMYLSALLLEHPLGKTASTYGLCALMCLHAARLPARLDADGNLVSLESQDRSAWDAAFIAKGHAFLGLSACGSEATDYQIEAAIASVHASARTFDETNWAVIVSLYDSLLLIKPSPVVGLNRAIAIGQLEGPYRAIDEMQAIADVEQLTAYPFYWAALGEFELRAGRRQIARGHYCKAGGLARNPAEQKFYADRMAACDAQSQ
jgi:RNA polymerase sigma-70 factor (ECF subfamily)